MGTATVPLLCPWDPGILSNASTIARERQRGFEAEGNPPSVQFLFRGRLFLWSLLSYVSFAAVCTISCLTEAPGSTISLGAFCAGRPSTRWSVHSEKKLPFRWLRREQGLPEGSSFALSTLRPFSGFHDPLDGSEECGLEPP